MENLKVGVIGVGYLGKFHARKYADLDSVELVGVADTDPLKSENVAGECSCRAFSDYRELLGLVDAVSIAVPTIYHFAVASSCIAAGVDLLLEKPITETLDEADELIRLAAEKKLILQIGQLERFNPAVQAIEPFLTTPAFIESNRIATFKNRGVDVDVVLDLMIHDIDIILNIIKSPLKTIHTVGAPVVTGTTDIANARLMFENGATANVTVSRISMSNKRKMRIFQPGSYITVDFGNRKVMTVKLSDDLMASGMPKPDIETRTFTDGDSLRGEIVSFIHHVRERTKPAVSGEEGRRALAVALQVIEQIKEHQKLDLFKDFINSSVHE
jgi:predicted dehydrogenase